MQFRSKLPQSREKKGHFLMDLFYSLASSSIEERRSERLEKVISRSCVSIGRASLFQVHNGEGNHTCESLHELLLLSQSFQQPQRRSKHFLDKESSLLQVILTMARTQFLFLHPQLQPYCSQLMLSVSQESWSKDSWMLANTSLIFGSRLNR